MIARRTNTFEAFREVFLAIVYSDEYGDSGRGHAVPISGVISVLIVPYVDVVREKNAGISAFAASLFQ